MYSNDALNKMYVYVCIMPVRNNECFEVGLHLICIWNQRFVTQLPTLE